MRTAGLLALAILLPLTAYAALININTADATLLDTLPGIGPSKAAAIIDYRTKNGPFATIEDIQKVSGIGPVTFANMKTLITVSATNTSPRSQPSVPTSSYTEVQAVKPASPVTSTKANIQQHEEAVIAPAAAPDTEAAAGAASPAPTMPTPTKNTRASGLFHSPWTVGLLGVIVAAGGVFIFL